MIKFAICTPNLTPGGAERHCIALAKYAPAVGMKCTGVAIHGWAGIDPDMASELAQYAPLCVEHRHVMPNGEPLKKPWSYQHAASFHFSLDDAVRAACQGAQVLLTWGSVCMGQWFSGITVPVVCISHCTVPTHSIITGITHLVGVSEASLAYFAETPNYQAFPRDVVLNGAEPERVAPVLGRDHQRALWGMTDDDTVIGNLARQSLEKRPLRLVRALRYLPPDYKAVYYGSDSKNDDVPSPKLVEEIARLGLQDRVRLLKPIHQLGDVLAGLDVFTLLSDREANSIGLLEAFLAGVPTVATPVGALPELERRYGRLCVRSPVVAPFEAVARSITEATQLEAKRLASKTQVLAQRNWTSEAMAGRWRDYLERILR